MPSVKLTTRTVIGRRRSSKATVELWDLIVPGLALRIHPGGARTYTVTTRINGRQIRRKVGSTVTHTLAQARDAARQVLTDAAKGIDSAGREARKKAVRQAQAEAERAEASTFRSVAEAWLADTGRGGGAELRARADTQRRLERTIFPALGRLPIEEITRADVRALVEGIARKYPVAANRTLADARRVLNWAVRKDRLAASPAMGVEAPGREMARDRVLADFELARLWPAFVQLGHPYNSIFKLLTLTGARRTEVSGLQWAELDGDMWRLPAERTKNARVHLIPLSTMSTEVIGALPRVDGSDYVFTMTGAAPVSGWGKVKQRLDKLIAEAAPNEPLQPWRVHDTRRTVVTGMNETLGIEPHVVEACVGHASGIARRGVAGIYNRAEYLPQRKAALEAWAQHVAAIVSGRPAAKNVVGLRRA